MTIKPRRIYSEQWDPSEEQIFSIFPVEEITAEMGRNPNLKVICDDEIRLKYPSEYNISVQARAHNQSLAELLQEYYESYKSSPQFAELMGVQLPQIKWMDTLDLEDTLVGLHLSKLNKQEIFINDIVLVKNEDFDLLSDPILAKILNNLRQFAKDQGAEYLSGYAANKGTLKFFLNRGFQEDKRQSLGNDYLWRIASLMGEKLPFYAEL